MSYRVQVDASVWRQHTDQLLPTEFRQNLNEILTNLGDIPVPCTSYPQIPCGDKRTPQAAPLEVPLEKTSDKDNVEPASEATVLKPSMATQPTYPQRERRPSDCFRLTFK